MIKNIIKLVIETAPKDIRPEYKPVDLKKKVDEYARAVESNQIDSEHEWEYLKCLYEKLSRKKSLTEEQIEIIDKLEDLMIKYGKHDSSDSVDLDAQYMNRGKDK